MAKKQTQKSIETLTHDESTRRHIPTAEYQALLEKEEPLQIAYQRRNRDLDPQLVWRGKDEQDWSDLVVPVPPLYIQEKIHPKVLIDDLRRMSTALEEADAPQQLNLFADFNGLPDSAAKTEFYQHDANWSNRMILGDSLQVMASLAEREGLRGKVQCIYIDPPYGIKFNSNFQWSTTSRDVKDGKVDHITREPEQVKAFRDTWRDGIHSYLTYLRDRLTVARDLLTDSGSVFVQIGDENVHRVRALMDEVFGEENFVSQINFKSMGALGQGDIPNVYDYLIWYAMDKPIMKFRSVYRLQEFESDPEYRFVADASEPLGFRTLDKNEAPPEDNIGLFRRSTLTSSGYTPSCTFDFSYQGIAYQPFGRKSWRTNSDGMERLSKAGRMFCLGTNLYFRRHATDAQLIQYENSWTDAPAAAGKIYVVQTAPKFIERCLLMTTDPGDLVLDPTCGSGTTAYVAEQWGRRWITIDTSRVALALARSRIMGARYPYYLLKDSPEGQLKEAEISRTPPSNEPTYGNIRQGFVYERVPHIMLRDIANNAEIDVIWESFQEKLEPLRAELNQALGKNWEEWEIPREAEEAWSPQAKALHGQWWQQRIARQQEIDASIAAKAEFEYLYDKPYEDKKTVRVAGPFTVESLSPHRVLGVDEDDELIDIVAEEKAGYGQSFAEMILENLKTAGVQQARKADRITFSSLTPWPGHYICAEGWYEEGGDSGSGYTETHGGGTERHGGKKGGKGNNTETHGGGTERHGGKKGGKGNNTETHGGGTERHGENKRQKRAGIFIGPEFGTVARPDLVAAAREAGEAGFDVLIACAFNYDARSTEFDKLGRVPVLKARMNADLHMADDLKNTGQGNLFVIFGEPDIDILDAEDGQIKVKVNGVDVFHPSTGEVRSDGAEGIAIWFVDTDYNEESFFVRQAYFLGSDDPYKALKTTLKAEINREAWDSLRSDVSRPFDKPTSGRIAVKVINHLGDEVMKVFRVR